MDELNELTEKVENLDKSLTEIKADLGVIRKWVLPAMFAMLGLNNPVISDQVEHQLQALMNSHAALAGEVSHEQ